MTQDKNFGVKLTLSEANEVRTALAERLSRLVGKPVSELTDDEKQAIGRLEKMIRIDF